MLFQIAIWILAIYGLLEIFIEIYRANFVVKNIKDMYILIAVKNQEESIEGIIRSMVFKSLYNKNEEQFNNIIIADMGSADKTMDILKRLSNEYSFLKVIDYKNSRDILNAILDDEVCMQMKQ